MFENLKYRSAIISTADTEGQPPLTSYFEQILGEMSQSLIADSLVLTIFDFCLQKLIRARFLHYLFLLKKIGRGPNSFISAQRGIPRYSANVLGLALVNRPSATGVILSGSQWA